MNKIILFFTLFYSIAIFAAPSQVVVVRHSDKNNIKPSWSEVSLSAKGYIRAIALAKYYLKNFGKPDFIISANSVDPIYKDGRVVNKFSLSTKEVQTAGPLLRMLNKNGENVAVIFYHPYVDEKVSETVQFILEDKKFKNKNILVIWDHFEIPHLINQLGVKQKVTEPTFVFDNVYILKFDKNGKLKSYQEKLNQYPIPDIKNWDEIYTKMVATPELNSNIK